MSPTHLAKRVHGFDVCRHPLHRDIAGLTLMIDNYDSFTYNIVQYLAELGSTVKTVRNDEITIEQLIELKPARLVISPGMSYNGCRGRVGWSATTHCLLPVHCASSRCMIVVFSEQPLTTRSTCLRYSCHCAGPGDPRTAGISKAAIRQFAGQIPILGVCLGQQCMIEEFGGHIVQAPCIMHGKTSPVHHDGAGMYLNVENPVQVTRYHSLCGEPADLPHCFIVSATSVELAENLRADWHDKTKLQVIQGIRHKEYCMEGVQFHPESITTQHGYTMLYNFLTWNTGKWHSKQ